MLLSDEFPYISRTVLYKIVTDRLGDHKLCSRWVQNCSLMVHKTLKLYDSFVGSSSMSMDLAPYDYHLFCTVSALDLTTDENIVVSCLVSLEGSFLKKIKQ
uniref:Uncharacterized protein n=1 Tax=Cuerna arida TaxID=1464854 RepID=A0A1B6GK86_9HEMI